MPKTLSAGRPTALLFVGGFSDAEDLAVEVDGRRARATARPGRFWAIVVVEPERPGSLEVRAVASQGEVELGTIDVVDPPQPPSHELPEGTGPPGLIAVCMTTFEPDLGLFDRQLASLRSQSDRNWICVISDDYSAPEAFADIERAVGDDPRFFLSRSEERLGFYRNYERALRLAPKEAELIALCDQDDHWYPEKLETLRAALGDATLVYSDQRLVDADGKVLQPTLWRGRSNNHTDLTSMLVANTITGAAALFRREVAELALPFPDWLGWQAHDQWLGFVALATGPVAYVDRPLYDYVQHEGAIIGQVTNSEDPRCRPGLLERWRAAYFYGYLSREVQARTLLARCAGELSEAKRSVLERFLAVPRSPAAFGWLAARALRALRGRNETLGGELVLASGILWRWLSASGRLHSGLPSTDSYDQRRLRAWRAGQTG